MSDLVVKTEDTAQGVSIFHNGAAFEHAQRIAKMLSSSDLVPANYKNNMSNTLVALEMAHRIGVSPLAVMQNMNVIHGKPSWSSTFIISSINSCGRFKPLRFVVEGEGDKRTCYAWTTDSRGERLEGPPVSIEMAKKEGWFGKSGSKWQTMPELMLRYRAAAFFGRLYAPEMLMGMHSAEEVEDAPPVGTVTVISEPVADLNKQVETAKRKRSSKPDAEITHIPPAPTPNDDELM